MLDNRPVNPFGTVPFNKDGADFLALYFVLASNGTFVPALASMYIKGLEGKLQCLPDIYEKPFHLVKQQSDACKARFFQNEANCVTNRPLLKKLECEPADTVFIVAPGKCDVTQIPEGSTTITVGNALNKLKSTYYIGAESNQSWEGLDYLDTEMDVSNTYGIFNSQVNTKLYLSLNWKDTGWYTYPYDRKEEVPYFFSSRGVMTDALCFAIEELKAKKIILMGVEAPVGYGRGFNYFWQGIYLQAFCWWFAPHGIEIWNCSTWTTVVGGVILGTVEEAVSTKRRVWDFTRAKFSGEVQGAGEIIEKETNCESGRGESGAPTEGNGSKSELTSKDALWDATKRRRGEGEGSKITLLSELPSN